MSKPGNLIGLVKEAGKEFSEDKAPRLGAALAYYTIFSIAPLLIITIAIVGMVFQKEAAEGLIAKQLSELMGPKAAEAVQGMVQTAGEHKKGGLIASALGLVTLLLGASGVVIQLKDALNTIWDVSPDQQPGGVKGFFKTRLKAFGLVMGVGFLLLVSLVLSAALSGMDKFVGGIASGPLAGVFNFTISFVVITGLFAMIFKFLPDIKITWKDTLLGAAVTSLLFTIGKSLIGMYLGRSTVASPYGAAGSLVILLIWVYYSAQILFFGAELTQVYTRRYGSLLGTFSDKRKKSDEVIEATRGLGAKSEGDPGSGLRDRERKDRPSRQPELAAAAPAMPALASRPSPAVQKAASGLSYAIVALCKLDTARKAVGLAPDPEDPISLGGTGRGPDRVATRAAAPVEVR